MDYENLTQLKCKIPYLNSNLNLFLILYLIKVEKFHILIFLKFYRISDIKLKFLKKYGYS
jgi:hypothetical protein